MEIKEKLQLDVGLHVIGRRLKENKLFCRVACIKEHLSAGHKAYRLQFAQNYLNFDEWRNTIFVDESTFMTGHAVRTLVRRPIGAAHDEKFIFPAALLWEAFSSCFWTTLRA